MALCTFSLLYYWLLCARFCERGNLELFSVKRSKGHYGNTICMNFSFLILNKVKKVDPFSLYPVLTYVQDTLQKKHG